MHRRTWIVTTCLLFWSIVVAGCASPTTPEPTPTATLLPSPTSAPSPTATATIAPTPTEPPTPTVEPTATPIPQNLDGDGFTQLGLLKIRVASNSIYQDKTIYLAFPEAQALIEHDILTAFAILRSGKYDDPEKQVKILQNDIANGKGQFNVWAYHANPDGSLRWSNGARGAWLTVDPAKGIRLTLRSGSQKTAISDLGPRNASSFLFGVTDDGQLVVQATVWGEVYERFLVHGGEGWIKWQAVVGALSYLMLGHDFDPSADSPCCEGRFPQLISHHGSDVYFKNGEATFRFELIDGRSFFTNPVLAGQTEPRITSTASATSTNQYELQQLQSEPKLNLRITDLKRGCITFTLRLDNQSDVDTYAFAVKDLQVTDDVHGDSFYEFDPMAMLEAGYVRYTTPGESDRIVYVLRSPISADAKIVSFTLTPVSAIWIKQHKSFIVPAFHWEMSLP